MPAIGEAVILIPGFMGSRLRRRIDGQTVWLDPEWNLVHLSEAVAALTLSGPGDAHLHADEILDRVPLGAFSPHVWAPLIDFLTDPVAGPGYRPENVIRFPYDWRLSVEEAAYALDSKLGKWSGAFSSGHPFVLLAHSYGGLVAAHALLTGNHAPARTALLVTFGVPFAGHLRTLAAIKSSDELGGLPFPGRQLRRMLGTWPGSYDLMPYRPSSGLLIDAGGKPCDAVSADIAIPNFDVSLAKASRGRLSAHLTVPPDPPGVRPLPVPVRAVYGAGLATPSSARVDAKGQVEICVSDEGDGTCPVVSALDVRSSVPNGRRIYPVPYGHHVSLVRSPLAHHYLRTELKYGASERFVVAVAAKACLLPAGAANEILVEVRDADGNGLLKHTTRAVTAEPKLRLTRRESVAEPDARERYAFTMPRQPTLVTIRIPELPTNVQPGPIRLIPAI
ncbi:MAG: lipase/acyltransferase domain-containing protein [Acidithiobacillales bacterium]